jgi:Zn-finger nucleic acid-binding protein
MLCPKCSGIELVTHEIAGGVTVDFCNSCQGLWFEKGEVGQYARFSSDIPNLKQVVAEGKKTGCTCPQCSGVQLVEIPYSPDSSLLIDYCEQCKGTWFDGGELFDLDNVAANPENTKLILGRAVYEMRHKMGKTDIKKCPKCAQPTLQAFKTSEDVEVDFCSKCKGIWLEKGETAEYVEGETDIPDLAIVRQTARKTEHDCPDCKTVKLQEMKFSPKYELLIDWCEKCQGIWLDPAEINTLENISADLEGAAKKLGRTFLQLKQKGYQAL